MRGTDVASFQTGLDYRAAKAAGIEFVVVKATDGPAYANPLFHAQVNNAYAAGLCLGYYHFWRQQADDAQQARHFWDVAGAVWERGERVCIDIEQPSDDPTPLPADTGERVFACAVAIERLSGVTPDLYMDRSTQARFFTDPKFARFGLWLAAWQDAPPPAPAPWAKVTIWQHSGGQVVPGIGYCDGDTFDGTAADWKGLAAPAPAPTPATDDGAVTRAISPEGHAIVTLDFGGTATDFEGVNLVDAGVSVRNAAGEIFDRSIQGNAFQPWVKRP